MRGSLFLGPRFRVTRNKLLLRDDLRSLVAAAVPGNRAIGKKAREWLSSCHATLDKVLRFDALADAKTQVSVAGIEENGGVQGGEVVGGWDEGVAGRVKSDGELPDVTLVHGCI